MRARRRGIPERRRLVEIVGRVARAGQGGQWTRLEAQRRVRAAIEARALIRVMGSERPLPVRPWVYPGPDSEGEARVDHHLQRHIDAQVDALLPHPLLPHELALLHERLRHEVGRDRGARRAAGAWTTPLELADLTVGPLLADGPRSVLDPACGAGMFLARAVVLARRRGRPPSTLRGVDRDREAVQAARRVLLAALGPDADLDDVEASIVHADALLDDELDARLGSAGKAGFDVVVGNPPYLFGETVASAERVRLRERYELASGAFDAYQLFVERGLELLAPRGRLAMVLPDAALARDAAASLRRRCVDEGLGRIAHVGTAFRAGVAVCVLEIQRGRGSVPVEVWTPDGAGHLRRRAPRPPSLLLEGEAQRFQVHASPEELRLLGTLKTHPRLGELTSIHRGEELGKRDLDEDGPIPVRVGADVVPFGVAPPRHRVQCLRKPADRYLGPKVLVVKTGARPVAAVDDSDLATLQSLCLLRPLGATDPHAIALLLNSRLARLWVHRRFTAYKGLFPQLNQSTLGDLPVPRPGPHWKDLGLAGRQQAASRAAVLSDEIERLVAVAYGLAPSRLDLLLNAVLP